MPGGSDSLFSAIFWRQSRRAGTRLVEAGVQALSSNSTRELGEFKGGGVVNLSVQDPYSGCLRSPHASLNRHEARSSNIHASLAASSLRYTHWHCVGKLRAHTYILLKKWLQRSDWKEPGLFQLAVPPTYRQPWQAFTEPQEAMN